MFWLSVAAGCATQPTTAPDFGDDCIIGRASVQDGDSLEIRGQRIRLEGIDAPEYGQTCDRDGKTERCGRIAASHLRSEIGWQPVQCASQGYDRYGRMLAYCYQDGTDLNEMMVRSGHAVAYRQYTRRYVSAETEARRAGRGIWATDFDMPWDWRRVN
ncbi:thermonuclease family protein [Amaricoccus tamworthensis]|uniref:thermonuclease family protein n=1 Tax=Amaricoccus tamworthensis TaxID=57002 RepID=UPI003C7C3E99